MTAASLPGAHPLSDLDQGVLDGVASGSASRADADLGEDRAQMGVNRSGADTEPVGDLAVGQAGCDQLQDAHLAGRQLIRKRLFRDLHQVRCCIVLYGAQHNSQGSRDAQRYSNTAGSLGQAVVDRVAGRRAAVRNGQLAEDFPEVRMHGAPA